MNTTGMRRIPDGFVQYVPSPGMDGIYPGRDACPHIVVLPVQGCCDPEFYCRLPARCAQAGRGGEMVSVSSEECIRCKEKKNNGQVCE